MKNLFFLAILLGMSLQVLAQPPEAFNYQAVVRDAEGEIVGNQMVQFRTTIRDGSVSGAILYRETHPVTTNQFGLATLEIGKGTPVSGSFPSIDWSSSDKYLQVECDPEGGTSYAQMGTKILNSVPYALFSRSSSDSHWLKSGDNISYTAGKVGIGVSSPAHQLTVVGLASVSNGSQGVYIMPETEQCTIGYLDASGGYSNQVFGFGTTCFNGYVGVGTLSPSFPFHVKDIHDDWLVGIHNQSWDTDGNGLVVRAEAGDPFLAQSSLGDLMIVKNNGNVGIGTTTPGTRLHVDDRIRIGYNAAYPYVYGELYDNGGSSGFVINAYAGGAGTWADLNFQTNGNTRMFITHEGRVGIGTITPLRKVHIFSEGSLDALYSYSEHGIGVWASSIDDYGLFAQSSVYYAGYFSGSVHVTGSLSKGSGSFVIDHPLDPENKLLRHNFVESPENLLIYRGKAQLNGQGEATVKMPDYFQALTKEDGASIHLTPVGRPFLTGAEWNADFSAIIIYGEANREVFWEVLADRDDPVIHELGRPVEELKGPGNELCDKGLLLYPEAYGYPESRGRDFELVKQAREQKSRSE